MATIFHVLHVVLAVCVAQPGEPVKPGVGAKAGVAAPAGPDAAALVRTADEVLRSATSLTFNAESQAFGATVAFEPSARGRVVISHPTPGKPAEWTFAITGAAIWPASPAGTEFRIVGDTEEVWSTRQDENRKEVVQGVPADTEGLLDDGGRSLAWWLIAWPELAAKPALEKGPVAPSWEGRRMVDGVWCDVIRFDASAVDNIETDSWWFIGEADHLPRRIDRLVQTQRGAGVVSLVMGDVRANANLDPEEFKKTLPVGFTSKEYVPAPVSPKYQARGRGQPASGALAPNFTLMTPTGQQRQLSDARGRVVVLAFWASWSKPSVAMLRGLKPVLERFKDREVTTWVLTAYEHGDAPGSFAKLGVGGELLMDADPVARRLGVTDLPAMVVIGPDGRTVLVANSGDEAHLKSVSEAIEKALPAEK